MLRLLAGGRSRLGQLAQIRSPLLPVASRFLTSESRTRRPQSTHSGLIQAIKELNPKKDYAKIVGLVKAEHLPDFLQTCIEDTYKLYDSHLADLQNYDKGIALHRSPFANMLEAFTRVDQTIGAVHPQTAWGMMELTRENAVLAQSVSILRLTQLCSVIPPNPDAPKYLPTNTNKWNNQISMVDIMADWVYYASADMRKTYMKKIVYDFLPNTETPEQRNHIMCAFMKELSIAEKAAGGNGSVTSQCLFMFLGFLRKPQKLPRVLTPGADNLISREDGTTMGHQVLQYMIKEGLLSVHAIKESSFSDLLRSFFRYPMFEKVESASASGGGNSEKLIVSKLDTDSMVILWNIACAGNGLHEVLLRDKFFEVIFREAKHKAKPSKPKPSIANLLKSFVDAFSAAINDRKTVVGGEGLPKISTHAMDGTPLLLSTRVCNILLEGFIQRTQFCMMSNKIVAGRAFHNLTIWLETMGKMSNHPSAVRIREEIEIGAMTNNGNRALNLTFGTDIFTYVQLFACFNSDSTRDRMQSQMDKWKKDDRNRRQRIWGIDLDTLAHHTKKNMEHKLAQLEVARPAYYTAHEILAMMARDKLMPDIKILILLAQAARRDRDYEMSKKVVHMAHALCYAIPRLNTANERPAAAVTNSNTNDVLSAPDQPSTDYRKIIAPSGSESFSNARKSRVKPRPTPPPMPSRDMNSSHLNVQLAALNQIHADEAREIDPDVPHPSSCTFGGVSPALLSETEMAALYNMAIDTARLSRRNVDCVYLLLAMSRIGLRPDSQALYYIFRALQQESQHGEVLRVYDLMTKWGIAHENKHMVCRVESLTALGKLNDAFQLLKLVQTEEMLNANQTKRSEGGQIVNVPPRDLCKPYTFMKLFDFLLWAINSDGFTLRESARPGGYYNKFRYEPHNMSHEQLIDAAADVAAMSLNQTRKSGKDHFDYMKCGNLLLRVAEKPRDQILYLLSQREPELSKGFIADVEMERLRRISIANEDYSGANQEWESSGSNQEEDDDEGESSRSHSSDRRGGK